MFQIPKCYSKRLDAMAQLEAMYQNQTSRRAKVMDFVFDTKMNFWKAQCHSPSAFGTHKIKIRKETSCSPLALYVAIDSGPQAVGPRRTQACFLSLVKAPF